ncbi:hypothetical protein [Pseudoduganella sp.]|uniref:hypothetical protein n=1 Tax=Pseudoduganella sp. TaxID=1880898 RepID=UPI0035B0A397
MKMKLIPLLALGLLAACQRTPDTPPAAPVATSTAGLNAAQKLELDLMRAVFGDAVRVASGQAQALADLPAVGQPNARDAMKVVPLGARLLANGQAALVTAAIPRDSEDMPGERPDALAASISAYLLEKVAGRWTLTQRRESIAAVGSHGETGDLAWLDLGQGRTGFALEGESANRGQTIRTLSVFDLGASNVAPLPAHTIRIHNDNDGDCEDERPRCWHVSGRWRMLAPQGAAPAELEVTFQGVLEQRAADAQALPKPASEAADYADEIPPRDKRQVKATARYALHAKGLQLLSGENIAEGIDG